MIMYINLLSMGTWKRTLGSERQSLVQGGPNPTTLVSPMWTNTWNHDVTVVCWDHVLSSPKGMSNLYTLSVHNVLLSLHTYFGRLDDETHMNEVKKSPKQV